MYPGRNISNPFLRWLSKCGIRAEFGVDSAQNLGLPSRRCHIRVGGGPSLENGDRLTARTATRRANRQNVLNVDDVIPAFKMLVARLLSKMQ
jgi:hypothetical protein